MSRRRSKQSSRYVLIGSIVVVLAAAVILLRGGSGDTGGSAEAPAVENGTILAGVSEDDSAVLENSRRDASPQPPAAVEDARDDTACYTQALALLAQARSSDQRGDVLQARTLYTQAFKSGLPAEQELAVVKRSIELADDTLYSPKRLGGDPLVGSYVVQSGDTLSKIARQYQVTAALLARINGLRDANTIRAGQTLKVLNGPFHAEIRKGTYEMFVFLQDTLVRRYRVGLGSEGSTPSGGWVVKDKLVNPTYYSPRGEGIILADDPENPLGERWIGLEGVSGEAVGQLRYGIHGTNDPQSVGSSESLGCVRLTNEDVERLYDMLVLRNSRVEIIQ